jgi:hypothetical protein
MNCGRVVGRLRVINTGPSARFLRWDTFFVLIFRCLRGAAAHTSSGVLGLILALAEIARDG